MYLKQFNPTAPLQLSSQRKRDLLEHFESNRDELDRWREFNSAYHDDDRKFMQFLIPPGKRVLELGCGRGDLLAALKPSYGVGVDFGRATIEMAKERHPELHFVLGDVEDPNTLGGIEGPFDYIVMADTIGMFEDIDGTLRLVHQLCTPSTRIVIAYYSHLWEPVLKLAEAMRLRSKQPEINYIATTDFLRRSLSAGCTNFNMGSRVCNPSSAVPCIGSRLQLNDPVRRRLRASSTEIDEPQIWFH